MRDDYKPARLADRTQRDIHPTHFEHKVTSRFFRPFIGIRLNTHQQAAASEVLLFRAIREKPEVANSHEAVGQHMQQEAAYELIGVQSHSLPPGLAAGLSLLGVFPIQIREGYAAVFNRQNAVV